jgi:hypothetical protein
MTASAAGPMTPDTNPAPARLSVVIASLRTNALIVASLDAVRGPAARRSAEIVVARSFRGADDERTLRMAYPEVVWVAAPPQASVPVVRGLGLAAAGGDLVALTEDNCVADAGWLDALLAAASTGADVVGGGMDNAQRARAVDWGAYFAEYGFFAPMRPASPGLVPLLTAANVMYRRPAAALAAQWAQAGEWENVIHHRLAGAGHVMRFAPNAIVRQNLTYHVGAFCIDRYEHGSSYARRRLADEPGRRIVGLLSTVALPILLTARVALAAAPTRWGTFLRALPVTALFLAAWSLGEAVGYARGAEATGPSAASHAATGA